MGETAEEEQRKQPRQCHGLSVAAEGNELTQIVPRCNGRLTALRGKGVPSLYSWSCKRSYKNDYVWNDLADNDVIPPADGAEYVLKGAERLQISKRGPQEATYEEQELDEEEEQDEEEKTSRPKKKRFRLNSSVLLQLISCGNLGSYKAKNVPCVKQPVVPNSAVKNKSEKLHRGVLCMSENPRFGNLEVEEEYFSGSIVESMNSENRVVPDQKVLKKSIPIMKKGAARLD
ncbi:Cellulase protein isoform 1 [Hibiscus syriacus]|uniref:Cellulase protein isoform 1 n=1 Tax=Hibiscus syriacus TaxID=106335 RepID=A0A6A3BZV9_HIBSY|nr:Cellulase protein isoform 1 [Hibiscus syriacus]